MLSSLAMIRRLDWIDKEGLVRRRRCPSLWLGTSCPQIGIPSKYNRVLQHADVN